MKTYRFIGPVASFKDATAFNSFFEARDAAASLKMPSARVREVWRRRNRVWGLSYFIEVPYTYPFSDETEMLPILVEEVTDDLGR